MNKAKKELNHYSNCCNEYLPNWPDSDICPRCKEHCVGMTGSELEEEEYWLECGKSFKEEDV